MNVLYATSDPLRPAHIDVIREAKTEVFGSTDVSFVRSAPGPGVLGFGIDSGVRTLSPKELLTHPHAIEFLAMSLRALGTQDTPMWDCDPERILYLDIESHNAGRQWSMTHREFFRLGQFAWGPEGSVILTTEYDETIDAIERAELVIAHNGHPFDFSVLLGNRALELAREGRLFDTMVFANLALPAPPVFVTRDGVKVLTVDKDGKNIIGGVKRWLSLDNLSYQLGTTGKIGDLTELAKKYNPPKTAKDDLDYGLIPIDDPDFLIYAEQDVIALRELTNLLTLMHRPTAYDKREQLSAAINAQMTRNGFRLDVPVARARVQKLADRKATLLERLARDYNFPTSGTMPWRKTEGKAAIMKILADAGITPESHPTWPKTKTGNISLGGDALIELTTGTPAEELGESLAELMGQRPLAQQALDNLQPDGYVHHDIVAFQRSGRSSTTKPSLTTWSAKGPKAIEKEYFIASPGCSLMEFDLSNADQRILAAISGDPIYAERFLDGVDGHEINGRLMFTDEVYDSDPVFYRNEAKAPGHAWTYGAGPKKLAWTTGLPLETMERFAEGMARKYPVLTAWQLRIRRDAEERGYTVNRWGRRMTVEKGRAWTQTPALQGQSGTTEVLKDGLIRMLDRDIRLILWMVGTVHDALVADLPDTELEWAIPAIQECLETEINGIDFPVGRGEPAPNWHLAAHV